jgi:hypothetical protein
LATRDEYFGSAITDESITMNVTACAPSTISRRWRVGDFQRRRPVHSSLLPLEIMRQTRPTVR